MASLKSGYVSVKTAYPVQSLLIGPTSSSMTSHGIWVMIPAPSPESLSAEHAPLCSMQPSAWHACKYNTNQADCSFEVYVILQSAGV